MATEFKLPDLGENIQEGDVVNVLVKAGDPVVKDQPVLEVETEKAAVEIPCPSAGTITEVLVRAGDKVRPGQVLLKIEDGGASPAPAAPKEEAGARSGPVETKPADPAPPPEAPRSRRERQGPLPAGAVSGRPSGPASPSVRRFAREIGVDIGSVPGSGEGGRVSIDDVKAYSRALNASRSSSQGPAGAPRASLPDFSKWGGIEAVPMSAVRRSTAAHLSDAWSRIPHVTHHDKTDITDFEILRKRYGERFRKAGAKLTLTALALKIAAEALKRFPRFNASLDEEAGRIILKKYVNIGVAVDTERGLLVPVIRDADKKSVLQLAVELTQSAERARSKKLSIDDMRGGCFTITNVGGLGGTGFTPVVNWPEVAILGMARGAYEPVLVGGTFEPRMMLPLSLSYDHRAIDGADAARFLRWVADAFQQPWMLFLEE